MPLFCYQKFSYNKLMLLIDELIQQGYLKTPLIIEAFRKINRADFLPREMEDEAELNIPLPIGFGQTISQPLTVAFMLELLSPQPGDKILDIGSGSGWTTALLSYIASQKEEGKVYAIERIPELVEFGRENVAKYNFIKSGVAEIFYGDGSKGLKEKAPFDKIQAAAAAERIPPAWKEQLKVGGRIVSPVGGSIWLLIKKNEKKFEEYEYPGFAFVPLISD